MGLNDISAEWRPDIDALQFAPLDHRGVCLVHRLAFRRLLGFAPGKDDCLGYFEIHAARFHRAASDKIARLSVPRGRNFHLTSRDIRRPAGEPRMLALRNRIAGDPANGSKAGSR